MGRDFDERFAASRRVFDEASDALALDLRGLCFEPDDRLGLTDYAQPAILATEVAMLRGLAEAFGLSAERFGGQSLGEYTALVAAGVMSLGDAVRIVRHRGRLMQQAVPLGRGRMVAVIGSNLDPARIARATVRWRDNMVALTAQPTRIVEVGPGRPLRGFFKAIGVAADSITDVRSAERVLGTRSAA
jgi:malonyl CoA-acyl carrier protein transacylase